MGRPARHGIRVHATRVERGADLHETPPEAVLALLRVCPLPLRIWEPAAGFGAIARVLAHSGRDIIASDLIAYAGADRGIVAPVDFLKLHRAPGGMRTIVTNPPYTLADNFIRHGLRLCERVIVLLRLAAIEGANRSDLIDQHLRLVYAGRERLPMMHRHGYQGRKIDEVTGPFGWFMFERRPRAGSRFEVERISWRVPVPPALQRVKPREDENHGKETGHAPTFNAQA